MASGCNLTAAAKFTQNVPTTQAYHLTGCHMSTCLVFNWHVILQASFYLRWGIPCEGRFRVYTSNLLAIGGMAAVRLVGACIPNQGQTNDRAAGDVDADVLTGAATGRRGDEATTPSDDGNRQVPRGADVEDRQSARSVDADMQTPTDAHASPPQPTQAVDATTMNGGQRTTMNSSGQANAGAHNDLGVVDDICQHTEGDILGPYYRPNVPRRTELDLYADKGDVLILRGRVLNQECQPVHGAIVDIWHAAPSTKAADELTPTDSVDYDNDSEEMRYRGQGETNAAGAYTFRTKLPGWYLNGRNFRPRHIHVKVWIGQVEQLTTQIYFKGDPFIDSDRWASADRAVMLTTLSPGVVEGVFDFVIANA